MSTFFGEELASGEFDGVGVTVLRVRSAGDFDGGMAMSNSKR